jgi:hypothetical protein
VGELGRFSAWTFEDPREGVLLLDRSVEPEARDSEALELGARESWLGGILDGGFRSTLREFSDRSVIRLIGGARC